LSSRRVCYMKTGSPRPRARKTAATCGAAGPPRGLRPHDLVLLHGQPGTAAD
jgi:hypothetical protein